MLSGIIVGGLASSLMSVLRILADPETTLAEIVYWSMGSIARTTLADVATIGPLMLICAVVLLALGYRLNVLSLGEREARSLGIDVSRIKPVIIITATLLTACSVVLAGPIGWVGLVIPHIARLLVGPDNTKVPPLSILVGRSS